MKDETKRILALPMDRNDAGANTIHEYLVILLAGVWAEGEGFSGKRPFGNSGWEYELYAPLVRAGMVVGAIDEEYGDVEVFDTGRAGEIIGEVIADFMNIDLTIEDEKTA